jgi:hypothetical protein
LCGVDVEDKIGALGVDLVVEGELEFDTYHCAAQYAGKRLPPLWACAPTGMPGVHTMGSSLYIFIQEIPTMNAIKLVAIFLIAGGALGLLYGGFSYTKETTKANIGPLTLQVKETERVNIPLWVGVGAVVGGIVLLVTARKP